MDELAAAAGIDPLDYRLQHLEDARAIAVLQRAAAMCGWREREKREGWGLGLGFARYKKSGAYAAVAAEIEAREWIFCHRL